MFEKFKQRSYELERLDTGDYTAREYARWEREMPWIHGFFGEAKALESALRRHVKAGTTSISVLDIGAGSGGILKVAIGLLRGRTVIPVAVELSDRALATIRAASGSTGICPVKASGTQLPFADRAFDYVICTLLMHHLSDDDAISMIREMDRVAAVNFYVIDLHRHPVGYYLYRLFSPLFLQRFTQQDGALSIMRSFTPPEMLELARKAGVENAIVRHSRANRLILSRG
jgi:ubiquinone/menaquinone biosynthesis C-methylase UbiE